MILIGLTGKARSGKDTVANYLAENYSFKTTAFATPMKEGCKVMFGLTDEHVHGSLKEVVIPEYGCSPRQILQWTGTQLGRDLVHKEVWVLQIVHQWQNMLKNAAETFHRGLIVTDVRFDNEAQRIRNLGGTIVHVDRASVEDVAAHSSEAGVRFEAQDVVCYNNGSLEDLYETVDGVARSVLGIVKT